MQNYGHLQVEFEDGSVGWYEAGWGPMMSEVAFFVKDVCGPRAASRSSWPETPSGQASDSSADIDQHTKTNALKLHHAELDADGNFARPDEWLDMSDEPDHQALCEREQAWFLRTHPRGHRPRRQHGRCGDQPAHRAGRRQQSIKNKKVVTLRLSCGTSFAAAPHH